MKAVVFTKYGTPDDLEYREVEKPVAGENEVLVKVKASSVNDWDWGLLRGQPFVNRLMFGLFRPKRVNILGIDVAGVVESVGNNITRFKPGDAVFGDLSACGFGAYAEYVCAPEKALTHKPDKMGFEQAAAIPQAGLLALQGLRDKRSLQPGQKLLINGAGGGTGSFAIQMAKTFGVEITGVDKPTKLDLMRDLGAGHVIDYTKGNFTKTGKTYDYILDVSAHHSIFANRRALSANGLYAMVGGLASPIVQSLLLGPVISAFGSKKLGILAHRPNKGMEVINELFEAGKVVSVIDRRYSLEEVPEALKYFGTEQVRGKVVVTID